MALDPTLRGLNDCGCCEGVTAETPATIYNRPGLPALAYRTGEHASFLRSMLAALSGTSNLALSRLQTREPDDPAIALLDAFATVADVLTFYSERIANESYLLTATERVSILHLARLIGYELAPGVAASTYAAFTLESAAGAPAEVTLTPGVRMQSVPGPGETPQVFETVETITARPAWNVLKPRLTQAVAPDPDATELYLAGVATNLKPGDRLLVAASASAYAVRRVATVTPENEAGRTRVTFEQRSGEQGAAPPGLVQGVWAFRVKAAPFGANAPKPVTAQPAYLASGGEWLLRESSDVLWLDSVQDSVVRFSWIVVERPSNYRYAARRGLRYRARARLTLLFHADEVQIMARADYGMAGRSTRINLSGDWLETNERSLSWARTMNVYAASEKLTTAEAPLGAGLETNDLLVLGRVADLPPGRSLLVVGQPLHGAAGAVVTERVVLESATLVGANTRLHLKKSLATTFDRRTVSIYANVSLATQGETVSEVLGGGDPSVPYQAFLLKQAPLTYTAGSNGIESSLSVRVNDVRWHETDTLYDGGARDRVYTLRTDADAATTVRFGDGVTGARPPRGADNIRATYRKGGGAAGNVAAGQLSLLLTRPLGVKDVMNPLPATGGVDAQTEAQARQNAPISVLTLGRVVSLQDYEDFSRGFPGVAKALATWTWDGRRRGVVVTVAGANGATIAEDSPTYASLLGALAASGDPHVSVRLVSHRPVSFRLTATVARQADALREAVELGVRNALMQAFSFDARRLGQPVALSEVVAAMQAESGVVGVDVDALYRPGQSATAHARLIADAPRGGAANSLGAELLTIDAAHLGLTVA